MKKKDGRRNRYQIQAHLPLPEAGTGQPAIGEVLALLSGAWRPRPAPLTSAASASPSMTCRAGRRHDRGRCPPQWPQNTSYLTRPDGRIGYDVADEVPR